MNKNQLFSFSYSQNDFPTHLVNQDCLRHREYLFNEDSSMNESKVNLDLSKSFIIEEGNLNKKSVNPKAKAPASKGWTRQNAAENQSKQTNPKYSDSNSVDNTIDFLKGGNINRSDVEKFVMGQSAEAKIKAINPEDHFYEDTMKESIGDDHDSSQRPILENMSESDVNLSQLNEHVKTNNSNYNNMPFMPYSFPGVKFPMPIYPMNIVPKQPEKVKIENIFNFNRNNNIPNDVCLWYLSMPWTSMLTGPLSSSSLVDMYNKHQIDSNWAFKPIDIFHFRSNNKNEIKSLVSLNNEQWFREVEDSPLLEYTELYTTSKKLLEEKEVQIKNSNKVVEGNKSGKVVKEQPKQIEKPEIRKFEDETLQLTSNEIKGNLNNFMEDTQLENESSVVINIAKHIQEEDGDWEKVDKKKKKAKEQDPSFYLIGNKPKKENKETKPTTKIDIVPPEDLVKNLMPKHLRQENKPNFEAFKVIGNADTNSKKKKMKGKPIDLDVKLGFKI